MNYTITENYKQAFINSVIEANKELYNYIHFNLKQEDLHYSDTIGFGGDNSLNIDLKAEEIFIKHLKEFGNIYSEECGYLNFNKDFTIVIDPIDGSNNFYANLEYYGSSVALKYKDEILAGFVCNLVSSHFIYKAFEEDIKEFYLDKKDYKRGFLDAKFGIFERAYDYSQICVRLNKNKIKFRSLGAAALSLANARRFDFVLFLGEIRDFDVEASLYICKDLYIYKTAKSLLISKDEKKFNLVKELINE